MAAASIVHNHNEKMGLSADARSHAKRLKEMPFRTFVNFRRRFPTVRGVHATPGNAPVAAKCADFLTVAAGLLRFRLPLPLASFERSSSHRG